MEWWSFFFFLIFHFFFYHTQDLQIAFGCSLACFTLSRKMDAIQISWTAALITPLRTMTYLTWSDVVLDTMFRNRQLCTSKSFFFFFFFKWVKSSSNVSQLFSLTHVWRTRPEKKALCSNNRTLTRDLEPNLGSSRLYFSGGVFFTHTWGNWEHVSKNKTCQQTTISE